MARAITTLDNSRYKKDYSRYFSVGDHYGDTHEIKNKEISEQVLEKVFDTVNTIIVIFPNEKGRIDGDLAHTIKEEDRISNTMVKELLEEEEVTLHSKELHAKGKADCKSAMRYFNF